MEIDCPEDIVYGKLLTKEGRQLIFGKVAGGSGSRKPEEYQISKIQEGTRHKCHKTNMRINLRTFNLELLVKPNTLINGFDYSENFDGIQTLGKYQVYINLKCIVGKGGSQTRSLREAYWFIQGQLNVLLNTKTKYTLFCNIFDGDEADRNMNKFKYLFELECYKTIKKYVYIGNLKDYFDWIKHHVDSK